MHVTRTPSLAAGLALVAGATLANAPANDGPMGAEAFCQAVIEVEQAFVTEDPTVIGRTMDVLVATAPAEVAGLAEALAGGTEDPAAYTGLIEYVKANCGFANLDIVASEYAFAGIPESVAPGPTVITLENIGEEWHEIVVMRINDDVTATLEELLALPEEEAMEMVTFVGASSAPPGESFYGIVDFAPGRYVAICFLPEGSTPDNFPPTTGDGAEATPHFAHGMVQEFTVTDRATATSTATTGA